MKLCAFRHFVDTDGGPLAGGKVYTYITGTATPKTTYTDSTGDTAHPNPIILGSNGVMDIWLDVDAAYRLAITDSGGTPVGDSIDDVVPITSLAAAIGGSDIDITGYSVITTANGNINLSPHGTGKVVINGAYKLPLVDGAYGQQLLSNGNQTLYWGNQGLSLSLDSTPTLSADLRLNGYKIIDAAAATMLDFTAVGSAVNYLNIGNNSTGNAPSITAAGSDTDINLTLAAKGAGVLNCSSKVKLSGGFSVPGSFTITDSTNSNSLFNATGVASQVNYLKTTASITGNPVLVAPAGSDSNINLSVAGKGTGKVIMSGLSYPTADGTANQALVTNGSGVLSFGTIQTFASQAQMEAASSTTISVAPANMNNHPGVAKAWAFVTLGAGSITVVASYGCTPTYDSSGKALITFATAFSSASYCISTDAASVTNIAAGSLKITGTNGTTYAIACFGDQ